MASTFLLFTWGSDSGALCENWQFTTKPKAVQRLSNCRVWAKSEDCTSMVGPCFLLDWLSCYTWPNHRPEKNPLYQAITMLPPPMPCFLDPCLDLWSCGQYILATKHSKSYKIIYVYFCSCLSALIMCRIYVAPLHNEWSSFLDDERFAEASIE